MPATYLIRFDDICPTMNWHVWNRIEPILVEFGVPPILAVIPDNRDHALELNPPDPRFWDRVREWQARGWTIGLHGYQHACTTANAGVVGLNKRSEFAGLSYAQQLSKLKAGMEIFFRENVKAE